jgi:hypothetical protein
MEPDKTGDLQFPKDVVANLVVDKEDCSKYVHAAELRT